MFRGHLIGHVQLAVLCFRDAFLGSQPSARSPRGKVFTVLPIRFTEAGSSLSGRSLVSFHLWPHAF